MDRVQVFVRQHAPMVAKTDVKAAKAVVKTVAQQLVEIDVVKDAKIHAIDCAVQIVLQSALHHAVVYVADHVSQDVKVVVEQLAQVDVVVDAVETAVVTVQALVVVDVGWGALADVQVELLEYHIHLHIK